MAERALPLGTQAQDGSSTPQASVSPSHLVGRRDDVRRQQLRELSWGWRRRRRRAGRDRKTQVRACSWASGATCWPIWAAAPGRALAWGGPAGELPGRTVRAEPGLQGTEGRGGHPGPGRREVAEAQHLRGLPLGVTWHSWPVHQPGRHRATAHITARSPKRGCVSVPFEIQRNNEYRFPLLSESMTFPRKVSLNCNGIKQSCSYH